MTKKCSKEELARDIEDNDEAKVFSAVDSAKEDEIEVIDHKGRKLKVKVKKIDPVTAMDDREGYT